MRGNLPLAVFSPKPKPCSTKSASIMQGAQNHIVGDQMMFGIFVYTICTYLYIYIHYRYIYIYYMHNIYIYIYTMHIYYTYLTLVVTLQ